MDLLSHLSEFIITAVVVAAGVILLVKERYIPGAIICLAPIVQYALFRSMDWVFSFSVGFLEGHLYYVLIILYPIAGYGLSIALGATALCIALYHFRERESAAEDEGEKWT